MLNSQPGNVVGHIEQLLSDRQEHADAMARIDAVLASVGTVLATSAVERAPGRPPRAANGTAAPAAPIARSAPSKRGARGTYAVTGDDLILGFIKQRRRPTTKEVKAFWASEGRKGTADNILSKLYKEGRVTRTPLGNGTKGSRYSLTPF